MLRRPHYMDCEICKQEEAGGFSSNGLLLIRALIYLLAAVWAAFSF